MNSRDLENAQLLGKTKFARFRDQFNKEWNKPNTEMIKARAWKEIDPIVKAELEKQIPEVVKRMTERYGK